MKSKLFKKQVVFLVCIAFAVGCIAYVFVKLPTARPTVDQKHDVQFFDERQFLKGVHESEKTTLPNLSERKIIGGITPHHLLASGILSRFFTSLSQVQPNTVLIIGPNHYENGKFPVLTSEYAWETPFGLVQPDTELITVLNESDIVEIDENVVPNDHSASGLIPYVSYYSPESLVVPVLVSNRLKKPEIELLADHIVQSLPENTVIIGAFDFSHYLNQQKAEEKDAITLQLIESRDYDNILNLSNDYTDSTVGLSLFLMIMDRLETQEMVMLDHTNSGRLLGQPNSQNTSYFSMMFVK